MSQDPAVSKDKPAGTPGKRGHWRPVLLFTVLIAFIVLAHTLALGERLAALRHWLVGLGPWGPAVCLLIYIAAVVAAIPGVVLTVTIGVLFGSLLGVILVSVGATVGAALAFLIARYFAREAVVDWYGDSQRFQQLDRLTARHGALMVAFTRLVPLFPFNLLNYAYGLTSVPFWTYVFWSWLCMLPEIVLYVVGADAITQVLGQRRVPWVLVGVFVAVLILVIFLVRIARRKIQLSDEQ